MTNAVARERFARHGFADRHCPSPAAAARLTIGLQSQDPAAGRLGVRARTGAVTDAQVRHALEVEHSLVKTSLMRATIHLVEAPDVGWLTALYGPVIARSFATRWRGLGLTPRLLSRTGGAIPEILADGPLTRAAITAALAQHGIAIDPAGQAPTHVLLHATTEGLVCRGPERGREPTYALLDGWIPAGPTLRGDDALAELARRYFAAFSPATAADFTAWSGLPSTKALALIRDELTATDVDGRAGFRLGDVEGRRGLRLLSAFDNYLVGYRDRSSIIDASLAGQIYIGGIIRPVVLLDGRVVGRWRLAGPAAGRADRTAELTLFEDLPTRARSALDAEVADLGRFLGAPLRLKLEGRG